MTTAIPAAEGRMKPLTLPWEPDGTLVADRAIGSLRDSILAWLTTARGVHVETLMTVTGALAGYAAQQAVWDAVRRARKPIPKDGFAVATTKSGERYYFGDMLNGYLVPQGARDWTLWGFVAAGAIEAGVPSAELPDYLDMFRHASATLGTKDFGIPRAPEDHQPQVMPRKALELFWPRTRAILTRTDGPGPAAGQGVAAEHWPAVLALVARQFIGMTKAALDPRLSVRLVMESAIMMSKIDPETLPQAGPEAKAS